MTYIIPIFLIVLSVLMFLASFLWKKKHFVKEVYCDQSILLLYLYIFFIAIEYLPYFLLIKDKHPIYFFILGIMDLLVLFIFISDMTVCVYLDNSNLIYKNMFIRKEIDLKGERISIKETFDKKIIISPKCKITINIRHLSGNVNTLFYNIKNIITDNTLNSENKILKDND